MWTAATLALVVVAALMWRGSDAAATESTTAHPADPPSGSPAPAVSEAWTTPSSPPSRAVVQDGRVLVDGPHGVRALDVRTGEEAWRYTRANARLCDLTVVDGHAVAVFATADRCDEAVAFDAGTGVRRWTRNLSLRPDITLSSSPGMVLATAPSGVVVLDPVSATLRWRAAASDGCRITTSGIGAATVVLVESCEGTTPRLRALDPGSGEPLWSRDVHAPSGASGPELAGVGGLVTLVTGDEVQVLESRTGFMLRSLPLPPGDPGAAPAAAEADGSTAVWARGTAYLLDGSGVVRWSAPAMGLPALTPAKLLGPDEQAVLVPEDDGFVVRDAHTGAELGRSSIEGIPAGGQTAQAGPVVVYLLADRVVAYR